MFSDPNNTVVPGPPPAGSGGTFTPQEIMQNVPIGPFTSNQQAERQSALATNAVDSRANKVADSYNQAVAARESGDLVMYHIQQAWILQV